MLSRPRTDRSLALHLPFVVALRAGWRSLGVLYSPWCSEAAVLGVAGEAPYLSVLALASLELPK